MNFEERLKAGLDDTPGGRLSEEQIRKIVRRAEKATGRVNTIRRPRQRIRIAATAGAAVVLSGVVLGGTLWSKHPRNDTGGVQTGNASIRLFDAGVLKPVAPLTLPSLTSDANQYASTLPVVKVNTTFALEVKRSFTAPSSVTAQVPATVAGKLSAYFVQMNAETAFYLIGPRGMTGKAELAADGSFYVHLKSHDANIELDTPGGSFIASSSIAAPFFADARKSMADSGLKGWAAIGQTTVSRPNQSTAYFAFSTADGHKVVGYDFYQPQQGVIMGPFGQSALMVYSATAKDWSLSQWVMNAGIAALNKIGEPQVGAKQLQDPQQPIKIGGKVYLIPNAVTSPFKTPDGIAWISTPPMVQKGSSGSPTSNIPVGSYQLMVGNPSHGTNVIAPSKMLETIPSIRLQDASNVPLYAFPGRLQITANRWLIYTVTWAAVGMNQPATNDLHVYDLKTGRDTLITPFHVFGGTFFAFGTSGEYLAYDQSGIIDGKGDFGHSVSLVDLSTGRRTKLPTGDLVHNTVQTTVSGQRMTIPLHEFP